MEREDISALMVVVGFFGLCLYFTVQAFLYGGLEVGIPVLLVEIFITGVIVHYM